MIWITGKQVVLSKAPGQWCWRSARSRERLNPTRLGEGFADGGVTSLVLVRREARRSGYCHRVGRDLPQETDTGNSKDVLYRAGEITANALETAELQNADVVIIRPAVGICIGPISSRSTPSSGSEKKPPANRWKRFTPSFRCPGAYRLYRHWLPARVCARHARLSSGSAKFTRPIHSCLLALLAFALLFSRCPLRAGRRDS